MSRRFLLPIALASVLVSFGGFALATGLSGAVVPDALELPERIIAASEPAADGLDDAIQAYGQGHARRAKRILDNVLRKRRLPRAERARANFLLGWVSSELGDHQQASAAFYRVRTLKEHPLAAFAAFLEARADLKRGHPRTAIKECEAYRTTWPEGTHASECLIVQADAYVAIGKAEAAAERYEAFLKEEPDDARLEPIRARTAQTLERAGHLSDASRYYRELYLQHTLPTTARIAESGWRRMVESGVVTQQEFSKHELLRRALSLRSAAQFDDSWDLYERLDDAHPGEGPEATDFGRSLDNYRHSFLWKNRKYGSVGATNAARYDSNPRHAKAAEHLHWAVEGYLRAGEYGQAAKYLDIALDRFGNHYRFSRRFERHMKVYEGAARYNDARKMLEAWRAASSRARKKPRTRFLRPYYAYRAGKLKQAVEEFTALADKEPRQRAAALFYRGKAKAKLGNQRGARADHQRVREEFPDSWYSIVLRSKERRTLGSPDEMAGARSGRWPGTSKDQTALPRQAVKGSAMVGLRQLGGYSSLASGAPVSPEPPVVRDSEGRSLGHSFSGWSSPALMNLGFGVTSTVSSSQVQETVPVPTEAVAEGADAPPSGGVSIIPPVWEPSIYWDPDLAGTTWELFVEKHKELWPELTTAFELSRAGLYELAGPIVAKVHKERRSVKRDRKIMRKVARWRASGGTANDPEAARWSRIADISLRDHEWLKIFGAAGYPASVTTFAQEVVPFKTLSRSSSEGRAAWTLKFPAAFSSHVWQKGWEHDIDPLLMLALMRVESRYRHDAVSRVGAMGLVQVMPKTGHRVAALMGDADFRVDRLNEPGMNIQLGTFYLGELIRRFGDPGYALGVASYNGGPHNVGRWLKEKVGIPFEEFVEEIQFRETRRYTKRVIEYYAIYCDLYAPGSWPVLPERTAADRPDVINF